MGRTVRIFTHLDGIEGGGYARANFRGGYAQVLRPEGGVFLDEGGNHLVFGVLEDHADLRANLREQLFGGCVFAIHKHLASGGQEQGVAVARQGGLARSIGAKEGDPFTAVDGEGDVFKRRLGRFRAARVAVGDAIKLD